MAMDGSKLIILVNTMEIREGRRAEFREGVMRTVRFAEERAPHLTGFARFPEVVAAGE